MSSVHFAAGAIAGNCGSDDFAQLTEVDKEREKAALLASCPLQITCRNVISHLGVAVSC